SAEGVGFIGNLNPSGTFRAAGPLLGLLAPEQLESLAYSMVVQARALRGPAGESNWGTPVGDADAAASAVLLAGALARGVRAVDAGEALTPLLKDWTLAAARWQEPSAAAGGLATLGADALGELARRSGEAQLGAAFQARAALQRQRVPDDLWLQAQHNLDGVLRLADGREGLADRLHAWFAPANPAAWPWSVAFQHVPWLYMQSSQPWAGDQLLRRLWRQSALPQPGPGEQPEQWAWTCFAILGLYPVTPQRGDYYWSAPMVEAAHLQLADALLALETAYEAPAGGGEVRRMLLNGTVQVSRSLTHRQLLGGGVLRFESTGLTDQ
ncbi:MAG: glycoside hydrolase family 92 protein, partial [Xanthomonadales bacterium]|nr:glycoside hydrolase family 92 protein [Xanthomonadales bacterium]